MNDKLLTLPEAAAELGVTYNTIRQYVFFGKIKSSKVGKNRMVHPEEIKRRKAKVRGKL